MRPINNNVITLCKVCGAFRVAIRTYIHTYIHTYMLVVLSYDSHCPFFRIKIQELFITFEKYLITIIESKSSTILFQKYACIAPTPPPCYRLTNNYFSIVSQADSPLYRRCPHHDASLRDCSCVSLSACPNAYLSVCTSVYLDLLSTE